jgi:phosphoenolpyruvate---glycerone phosphotransferase subunit DhaL
MSETSLSRLLTIVADDVLAAQNELNRLDGAAGDGDLGVSLSSAAIAIKQVASTPQDSLRELLNACGVETARAAPSTCGTLVATAFLAAARMADSEHGSPTERTAVLINAAATSIARRGGARLGDRTLLDALVPAAEALQDAAQDGVPIERALAAAAEAAASGAEATRNMLPQAGRARWLGARPQGHEDGGAVFVSLAFASSLRALHTVSS